MYFVIHNSVVLSKILKIVVPLKQNLKKNLFLLYKIDYFYNNQHSQTGVNNTTIFNIFDNTTELWTTKYIIGEIFSSGSATLYKNPSDQTVCTL